MREDAMSSDRCYISLQEYWLDCMFGGIERSDMKI